MSDISLKDTYAGLSDEQKMLLLPLLSHQLTISARGSYPGQVPPEITNRHLVTYNEIQHQVSSMVDSLMNDSTKRYPDDVFMNIIIEKAKSGGCEQGLQWAFESALSYILDTASRR